MLLAVIKEQRPMTCRQSYYQLAARQIIDKKHSEYQNVCRYLCDMRRDKVIGYGDIADMTRRMRKSPSYNNLEEAVQYLQANYRRDLWAKQPVYVEVWCESDSVAGVIDDVTDEWNVPVYSLRGFPSETLLYNIAHNLREKTKPIFIYYFGDYDPSGVCIEKHAERKVRDFAPHLDITFERVAVTKEQINQYNLPGAPPKPSDSRTRKFDHSESVEIETLAPSHLRRLVGDAIYGHIDEFSLHQIMAVENAERETMSHWPTGLGKSERADDW
jgi:hypothetical protein